MTEAPTGAGKLALRPFKVGGLHFEPGDRYDPQPSLTPRQEQTLVDQKYYAEFTPEAYRLAIQRRPPGSTGKGWTAEYLYQTGAAERPAHPQQQLEPFVPKDGDAFYRGYTLRGRPCGIAKRFMVLAPNGEPMHDREFLSEARAMAFVDGLPALPSTDSDGSATTGADAPGDADDDRDLQRQSA